ncbi:MAG: glycosyltransferase family 9 protein [Bacillota bacterium]
MRIKPKKILIIRLSSIGDVLLTTPVIKVLKNNFPKASLSYLVEDKSEGIIKNNPYLDEVIIFSKKELKNISQNEGKISAFKYIINFINKLKKKDYDLVIDLHSVFRSGVFSFFTFADYRIGFKKQLISLLYTKRIKNSPGKHVVDEYLSILKTLDIDYKNIEKEFTINIPVSTKNKIDNLFNENNYEMKKKIAIVPSTSREKKDWDEKKFAKLADWLINKKDVTLFLLGSPPERKKCLRIKEIMRQPPVILAGKTDLIELAEVIRRLDLLITGDTAPLHIAMALNTKLVGLYGPTSPKRYGPYKGNNLIIKSKNNNIDEISVKKVKEKVDFLL